MPYRQVILDIGTGDGRFISTEARRNPTDFYIGIDANVKPLEKPSMKATRKPSKGGLPNAIFVQAAVEDLPEEFNGVANKIHINFPWGSLSRAVATGDADVITSLRRIAARDCLLEIVMGFDSIRDKTELRRLNIPELLDSYLDSELIPRYETAGLKLLNRRTLGQEEWSAMETSWARKLQGSTSRKVVRLIFARA